MPWPASGARAKADGRRAGAGGCRVEALLEGDAAAVEALVAWMRRDPPRAEADEVVVTDAPPPGLVRFEVR